MTPTDHVPESVTSLTAGSPIPFRASLGAEEKGKVPVATGQCRKPVRCQATAGSPKKNEKKHPEMQAPLSEREQKKCGQAAALERKKQQPCQRQAGTGGVVAKRRLLSVKKK